MNHQPQLQKAKECAAFKVPDSNSIWHPSTGEIRNYGIEGAAEIVKLVDGKYESEITTRWFSERELKDAVFFSYSEN